VGSEARFGSVGWVFFRGWVGGEPGALLLDHLGSLFAEVTDGFEGYLAGDVVGFVVGWGFDGGGPAVGGVDELGKGFADVLVVGAVVVKVVVELVGERGELLEEVMCVLFAAGTAGDGVEILDALGAGVEELDVEENAVGGDVGGFADLLDLGLGECVLVALGVDGQG